MHQGSSFSHSMHLNTGMAVSSLFDSGLLANDLIWLQAQLSYHQNTQQNLLLQIFYSNHGFCIRTSIHDVFQDSSNTLISLTAPKVSTNLTS